MDGQAGPGPSVATAVGSHRGRSAQHLPGSFWRTWVVVLTARSAQFVEAFLPLLLLQAIGATAQATGVVLVSQQLAATVAYALARRLVRRLGLVGVVRWGLLGSAASVGLLALAPTVLTAGLAAALYGASSGAWRTGVQALVPTTLVARAASNDSPAADDAGLRARAFGAVFWAANLGAIASAAVGAAGVPLRTLFAVQAATTTAAFVLTWWVPSTLDDPSRLLRAPWSQSPTPREADSSQRRTRVLVVAFVPATMLMFQAFGGLAVAMPPGSYRRMVLVNALVLVLAQPLMSRLLTKVGALTVTAAAIVALTVGIPAQAHWPDAWGWTVLWSLGELVVVIVPGALIAAATPTAEAAGYVGRFQLAQGVAATVALYLGPALAGTGPGAFTVGCVVVGAAGLGGLAAASTAIRSAWRQPLACPCGALFCVCDRTYQACVVRH